MHREYLMGNEAIALGALAAGVNVAAGYPGTPSTEVLQTVARRSREVYTQWSVNEKAAMELGAGAAYAGARVLVTMKQVGLNVAADPLMSLEYIGVKGGMVIMVADDPGPISSQTEQDTRRFAAFSQLPCFDPSTVAEAYTMIQQAFAISEEYGTPVFFRPTTRVCHAYTTLDIKDEAEYLCHSPEGFVRDPSRWVIFPKLSVAAHRSIVKRNELLGDVFSDMGLNPVREGTAGTKKGILTQGISAPYVYEAVGKRSDAPRIMQVGTPFPFPEKAVTAFLSGLEEVLCVEELSPVLEEGLLELCGKQHICLRVLGKLTGHMDTAGENTIAGVSEAVYTFMGWEKPESLSLPRSPALPPRPPVLCAGCPHRASFYAVKQAMKGKKATFCGDIGCYTLGNAQPLDMVDTCLCMGAGINIAQGLWQVEPDRECFAFVGDSTFFASAITGIINGVYNGAKMTVVVLDNATTAMTGHQPHPGTGKNIRGEIANCISIEKVLEGIGVPCRVVDPFKQAEAIGAVREMAALPGVKAIVFRSPCAVLLPSREPCEVDPVSCIGCKKCIKEIGCPAIAFDGRKALIGTQCTGCGLCVDICPKAAIRRRIKA